MAGQCPRGGDAVPEDLDQSDCPGWWTLQISRTQFRGTRLYQEVRECSSHPAAVRTDRGSLGRPLGFVSRETNRACPEDARKR
jgi:hypothetical protein